MNIGEVLEAKSKEASRLLDRLAKPAERAKVPVRRIVRTGEVKNLVKSAVSSEGADLIVVGAHKRLFGERVLRSSPCPVLMIPPGTIAKQKKRSHLRAA
jgi:nucleotide-binding universal stress UspA family protein